MAARGELDRLGVPHRRPTDYFAEMLKSDDHMKRVKEKLLLEKQKITAVEHRKKEKDAATFNKQAAAEKARTKASEKRSAMQAVDAWRKGKAGNRPELENEADLEKLFDSSKAGKASAAARQGQGGSRFPSKSYSKRQGKDKKYGHGGPKRDQKRNSADSSSSMGKGERGGYSAKGMKSSMPPGLKGGKFGGRKGGAKGGARKNAGGSRPGKRARMAGHK